MLVKTYRNFLKLNVWDNESGEFEIYGEIVMKKKR